MSDKKIKLFCMQKDEDDILEIWIKYHGHIFGYENLYLIDNGSTDQSLNIINQYLPKGVHLRHQPDYARKGDYICDWIKETCHECDIAIPMDIDEFIGVVNANHLSESDLLGLISKIKSFDNHYYIKKYPAVGTEGKQHYLRHGLRQNWDSCAPEKLIKANYEDIDDYMWLILKNFPDLTISCNKDDILEVFNQLPMAGRYAFCYYLTSRHTQMNYQSPLEEITNFDLVDCSNHLNKANYNKKFFESKKLNSLDHGHHYGKIEGLPQSECCETNLVLFHYHHRGYQKLIQKCRNDILGLGHIKNINDQRELSEKIKQETPGSHNIQAYLNYLIKGPSCFYMNPAGSIPINAMSNQIKQIND